MKEKRRYFKTNDDYFKFYSKVRDKIKVKNIRFVKNKIALIYFEEVEQ